MNQLGENKYQIGFEAAGDDWDYNELVIDVKVEPDCDEEIELCNNPQPQIFNTSWIEKYKNYSYFVIDPTDPNSMQYTVTGCQLKKNDRVQGITFLIPGMPLDKYWGQGGTWSPQNSAEIKVCLFENERISNKKYE